MLPKFLPARFSGAYSLAKRSCISVSLRMPLRTSKVKSSSKHLRGFEEPARLRRPASSNITSECVFRGTNAVGAAWRPPSRPSSGQWSRIRSASAWQIPRPCPSRYARNVLSPSVPRIASCTKSADAGSIRRATAKGNPCNIRRGSNPPLARKCAHPNSGPSTSALATKTKRCDARRSASKAAFDSRPASKCLASVRFRRVACGAMVVVALPCGLGAVKRSKRPVSKLFCRIVCSLPCRVGTDRGCLMIARIDKHLADHRFKRD